MRDFTHSVDIDAPPVAVWKVIRDVASWPEWTATVRSIRPLSDGPLRIGQRFRVRQPKLLPAIWGVTEIDEGRGFVWVTRGLGFAVCADHRVEPERDGSRVTLSLRFDGLLGGLLGRVTAGLNARYLDIEASGLKRQCELPRSADQKTD
jgi:hypothetical protein